MITFQCVHSIMAWWKHVNKEHSRLDWTIPKGTLISLLQEKNDHFNLHGKNFIANHPSCINNFYLSRRKKKISFFLVQYLWSFLCFKRPDPLNRLWDSPQFIFIIKPLCLAEILSGVSCQPLFLNWTWYWVTDEMILN